MHTWLLGWGLLWGLLHFLVKKEEGNTLIARHFIVLALISAYYLFERGTNYWMILQYDNLWNYFFSNNHRDVFSPLLPYFLIVEFFILLIIVLGSYKTVSGSKLWQNKTMWVVLIYTGMHLAIQGFDHIGFATSIIPGGTSTITTKIGIETLFWVLQWLVFLNWLIALFTRKSTVHIR
ncbi:hypothetical protein [Lewinella sp. LCG006]|uniref:hypothetical protein n=1 Tax=Lewinella sp. LCG006 TaxID=3231911 RepID=UPI00346167B6